MNWMGWQIDYLLFWQHFSQITNGALDNFFLIISQMGIPPFTLIILLSIYWSIDKKLGMYLLYSSALSFYVNIFLKFTFCIYRPWLLDSRICPSEEALKTAPGYSFPSGHTAGAVSFWGCLGYYFKERKNIVIYCLIMIFLVMLSRNYLCVHTSQDVIVSFIVGVLLLAPVKKMIDWAEEKEGRNNIIILTFGIFCIILWTYLSLKSYPQDYVDGKLLYDVSKDIIGAKARILNIFAIFLGLFLEQKYIKFNPKNGSILRKIILVILGISILWSFENYIQLNKIISYEIAKYIKYFVSGLFITLIYPGIIKLTDIQLTKMGNNY